MVDSACAHPVAAVGHTRASFAVCLVLLLASPAWAQPDVWGLYQPAAAGASVRVVDATTGALRHQFAVPSGVCIGSATMSVDGRSYFVGTNWGIARFDVPSARFVDVRPITGMPSPFHCPRVYVSSTSRWWYVAGRAGPIGVYTLEVVDPATGATVRSISTAGIQQMVFGEEEWRYQSSDMLALGSAVSAWSGPHSLAPAWALPPADNRDIEAAASGVYVLSAVQTADTVTADIVRYEPQTGTELARASFSRTSAFTPTVTDIAVVGNRVVLSGGDLSALSGAQQFLASFDADTLAPERVAYDSAGAGQSGTLFVDSAGAVRLRRTYTSGLTTFEHWFAVDADTLGLTGLWSGSEAQVHLAFGVASPPGAPALTVTPTADRRLALQWVPDAHGYAPWTFLVRGNIAGQPIAPAARVPGDNFTWTSPPLPPGSYAVEVAAENGVGPGPASNRVVISVGEASLPAVPQELTAFIVDDVLRLSWLPPAGGPVPEGFLVEGAAAGSQAFAALARLSATEWRLAGVPQGEWQARVRAFTAGGPGPASAAVPVSAAACQAAPAAPSTLAFVTSERTVSLQWLAPAAGSAAEYVIEAGSSPGLTDLARIATGGPAPVYQAPAAPGAYYVRVRGRNACGDGPASNEAVIVVP